MPPKSCFVKTIVAKEFGIQKAEWKKMAKAQGEPVIKIIIPQVR